MRHVTAGMFTPAPCSLWKLESALAVTNMSVAVVATSLEAVSVDAIFIFSLALVGAAGALLTYLLVAWSSHHHEPRSTTPHDQSGPPAASDRGAASASEAEGHAAQSLKPLSGDPRELLVGSRCGMHRRPTFQHHDSSSTLPPPSLHGAPSLGSTTSFSASFNSGRSSSSSTHHSTLTVPSLTQKHNTPQPSAGHSSSAHKQLQLVQSPSSDEEDLVPASDQVLHPQTHEQTVQAKPGGLSQAPQAGAAGRLFVPAFVGLPQPSPLRAVSAPLAGLAAAGSSALEVLPSLQSITDPSGSITAPVSTSLHGPMQADVTLDKLIAAPGSMQAAGQQRPSTGQQADTLGVSSQGAGQKWDLTHLSTLPVDDSATAAAASQPSLPQPRLDLASLTASGIPTVGVAATTAAPAPASVGAAAQPGTTPSLPLAMQPAAVHADRRPASLAASANLAAASTTPRAAGAPGASSAAAGGPSGPSGRAAVPSMPVPLVRPLGVCLPSPWNPAAGAAAGGARPAGGPASSLYGAASASTSAQALPTNALYRSPLQHVTLSVKVPARFSPSAASNLQSMVARSVWAGESRLTGPDGQPSDPQFTVLHMVSIPGCIQLFINFTQWQPHGEADSTSAEHSAHGTAHSLAAGNNPSLDHSRTQGSAAAVGSALLELGQSQGPTLDRAAANTSRPHSQSQSTPAAMGVGLLDLGHDRGAGRELAAAGSVHQDPHHAASGVWWQGGVRVEGPVQWAPSGGMQESVPAPPWLVKAVCSALEAFMRAHGAAEAASSAAVGAAAASRGDSSGASASAGQQQAAAGGLQRQLLQPAQQHQTARHHYEGPVLLSVNGTQYTLEPNPADADAAWVLQVRSSAQEASLQAVPPFTSTTAMPVQHITPAAAAAPAASTAPAATPAPVASTPAGVGAPAQHRATPSQLLQRPPGQAATAASPADGRSSSPSPAAARTFISTVAHGVAAMHERGSAGLFAGLEDSASAAHAALAAPAAAGLEGSASPDQAAPAATGAPSSSSNIQPSALLRLSTTSRASLALPPGMWAWPLYLPTTGVLDCAGGADVSREARVAVCGSSAAASVVGLHGLQNSSCRVVLANADGSVVIDKRVPVEDGVARFLAPASTELRCCKIFYLLPPSSAPAASPSGAAAASPGPAAATSTPPAAAPAAPALADQLLCMLPLLYLPPAATVELCEAARALMLARSCMMFTQQLLQEEQERLQEPSPVPSSFNTEEEGWTVNAGASAGFDGSHEGLLGTLSLDRHVAGAGAGAGAAGRDAPPPAAGAGAFRAPAVAGGLVKEVLGTTVLPDAHRDSDQQQLGVPHRRILGSHAEQLRAEHGTSQHVGSFDTTLTSSGVPRPRSFVGPTTATAAGEPLAATAAAARVLPASSTSGIPQGRPLPPWQQPQQQQQRRQQQQQQPPGAGGGSSSRQGATDLMPNRRRSTESAGHSGSSSSYESRTGLEDEPSKLNLRGRLFEGSSDVHALLNSQYLPILADLGLLIELATAADGSASTSTNPSSSRGSTSAGVGGAGGGGGDGAAVQAHQHAGMAAEVGLQLLVWFSDMECWHCCQLVLQLLLQLGVELCFNDFTVTAVVVASVVAVQQLLQKPGPAGIDHGVATVPAVGHTSMQAPQGMMQPLVPATEAAPLAASSSDVSRAGIWGHLRSEFPTVPVQAQSPAQRRLVPLPAAQALLGGAGFGAGTAAATANPSSRSSGAAAAGTVRPLLLTTSLHGHTSNSSTATSFHSADSELLTSGAWAGVGPAAPTAGAAQAGGPFAASMEEGRVMDCVDQDAQSPVSMPPALNAAQAAHVPAVGSAGGVPAVGTAGAPAMGTAEGSAGLRGLEVAVQQGVLLGQGVPQGEVGGVGELLVDSERQHRRLGILDSASDMWTRLRRRSFRKQREREREQ